MDRVREIREKLDRRTLLEQLAEESAELSQAALKLIRAEHLNNNPTPKNPFSAYDELVEEIRDIFICLVALDIAEMSEDIEYSPKWDRWIERIRDVH